MLDATRKLSDAEVGRLFRGLLRYSMTEEQPQGLQGREEIVFDIYSQQIDREIAKYNEVCKRNQRNVTSRYQSLPIVTSCNESLPPTAKTYDLSQDKDKDKGKGKDKGDHHDDACAKLHTVEAYASGNLQYLSPGNMEELGKFKEDLPDDVIRFAIDEACGNGAPRWSYVAAILRGYIRDGVKTVGDAKAAKERHSGRTAIERGQRGNKALDYTQRDNSGYDDFQYFDPTKYKEGK